MRISAVALIIVVMTLVACDLDEMIPRTVEICNENSEHYHYALAVGYFDRKSSDWVSSGWYQLSPGDCVAPITARHDGALYLHGKFGLVKDEKDKSDGTFLGDVGEFLTDLTIFSSRTDIGGTSMFCIHPSDAFLVTGNTRCASRGYQNEGFSRYEIRPFEDTLFEFIDGPRFRITYE